MLVYTITLSSDFIPPSNTTIFFIIVWHKEKFQASAKNKSHRITNVLEFYDMLKKYFE